MKSDVARLTPFDREREKESKPERRHKGEGKAKILRNGKHKQKTKNLEKKYVK